ncbi:MAG: PLP-dependent transferase [Saccharofermentans sp.]|nr:PLP-dependent transferase [Saccharofermentans sp.]
MYGFSLDLKIVVRGSQGLFFDAPVCAYLAVSFEFAGTEEQKRKFIESVNIFGYQANIGDARSLIVNPAQTTHGELTHEQREVTGLSINTIRLSIGLEDPQDLIDDLDQAFVKAFE